MGRPGLQFSSQTDRGNSSHSKPVPVSQAARGRPLASQLSLYQRCQKPCLIGEGTHNSRPERRCFAHRRSTLRRSSLFQHGCDVVLRRHFCASDRLLPNLRRLLLAPGPPHITTGLTLGLHLEFFITTLLVDPVLSTEPQGQKQLTMSSSQTEVATALGGAKSFASRDGPGHNNQEASACAPVSH